MRYRDPTVIDLIAPLILQVLHLPADASEDMKKYQSKLLNCMCRELEKFLIFRKSESAHQLAQSLGLGDLSRFRWDDQTRTRKMRDTGRKNFHLEHTMPVAMLVRELKALKRPTVKDVATVIARAEVSWITKKEDVKLTELKARHKRPDPVAAYAAAGIALCDE
jgi:hypothetical protein